MIGMEGLLCCEHARECDAETKASCASDARCTLHANLTGEALKSALVAATRSENTERIFIVQALVIRISASGIHHPLLTGPTERSIFTLYGLFICSPKKSGGCYNDTQ